MAPWVTFDIDGTLMRSPYWALHLRPWLEDRARTTGQSLWSLWQAMRDEGQRRWRRGRWKESYDWQDIAYSLWEESLPDPDPVSVGAIAPYLLPGAVDCLMALSNLPIRLGIVTNGLMKNQRPYIQSAGWSPLFSAMIGCDSAETAKPSPKVFDAVQPLFCHVGDRLEHDVLGAKRVGAVAVFLQTDPPILRHDRLDPLCPSRIQPDHTIQNLHAVFPLIAHELKRRALFHV